MVDSEDTKRGPFSYRFWDSTRRWNSTINPINPNIYRILMAMNDMKEKYKALRVHATEIVT